MPLKAVRFYFSGSKGFSIELPATLFGGFEPSAELPRRLKRAAALLLDGIEYDGSIYSLLRLWRVPNSRHGKSGLYKVPLTAGEILTLGIDEIRALAARPRTAEDHPELTPIPDDEWHAVDALVDIWARAASSRRRRGADPRAAGGHGDGRGARSSDRGGRRRELAGRQEGRPAGR